MIRRSAIAVLLAYSALPMLWAVAASLKPLDEVYRTPPSFFTSDPQWNNYAEAVTRLPVPRFLWNSLVISTTSMVGAVLTSAMAGYALARFSFPGRRICGALVVFGLFLPSHVLLVPRFLLCDALGWIDTYKPLIVPAWLGGGAFNVFLFRQAFRSIPRGLDDAARLDGASEWRVFVGTMLPAARPAVITAGLLSFVFHWQDFLDPLLYLSDFNRFPISLGLRMYQSSAGTWTNLLMAASVVALLPILILFLLCERWIMRGFGAVVRTPMG